jgi:SAM-dependent methyltransferase
MIKNSISLLIIFFLVTHCCSMDMTKQTLYLGLCTEFWDLDKPTPPIDEHLFFRHYVAQSAGPILEPMCGSGRYMIPLLEEGFNIEGFDASPFMFKALRTKCAQKNLSPRIWEQFLEVVPETKQYQLIFIPDTSFCHFLNTSDIKKALQKIHSLLLPGGTFVFDLQTPFQQFDHIGVWTGKAYKKSDGDTIIESTLMLPIQNSIAPLIVRYELMSGTEIVKTEMEHYQIKLYQLEEMDVLLKEVGFRRIKKMPAYDREGTLSAQEGIIVYECKK